MLKPRYLYYYQQSICDTLINSRRVSCVMELPSLQGLVAVQSCSPGASSVAAQGALSLITGQRAKALRAKKSIAAFNLRENDVVSCVVTLRGAQLYKFLDLLLTFVMPKWENSSKVFSGRSLQITASVPEKNGNEKKTSKHLGLQTQRKKKNTISFGQSHIFSFPQLEPYFPQFESSGGFNMHIAINEKRNCQIPSSSLIWGF